MPINIDPLINSNFNRLHVLNVRFHVPLVLMPWDMVNELNVLLIGKRHYTVLLNEREADSKKCLPECEIN